MPTELTEREKTIFELWQTNGRKGLHQFFAHEGLDLEQQQLAIESFPFLTPETENIALKPVDPTAGLDNEYAPVTPAETAFAATHEPSADNNNFPDSSTETVQVTFADGSTHELEVGPDNVVVNPVIPTPDAIISEVPKKKRVRKTKS